MILIGLGSNLPYQGRLPQQTIARALASLQARGVTTVRVSRLFHSPPKPHSSQPWFANCVAQVRTSRSPQQLLACLHDVERVFGRVRRKRWSARTLDLDLLAYGDQVVKAPDVPHAQLQRPFVVPHPALADRSFVLLPLQEIAPQWKHPVSGVGIADLVRAIPRDPLIYATQPDAIFGARRNAASLHLRKDAQSLAK